MQDEKTLRKLQDAQHLYHQERWAEALKAFDDLSLSYKSDRNVMLSRAMCLARIGKEEEAELLCDHISVVHQDPRGAQLKAQIPQWKKEGKSAPPEAKERRPILSGAIVRRGLIGCFIGALLLAVWTFYSTYEAAVPETIVTMPAPGERTLPFPADFSLGTVSTRDWGYASNPQGEQTGYWQELGPAQGRLTVPAGKEVMLKVLPAQSGQLGALRRLRANDLQSLWMNQCRIADEDMAHIAHLSGLFELSIDDTPIGPAGYAHLGRLTSLRRVSIIDTTLGDTGRQFIGQQPFLEHIDADRADLGDDWLIGLPPLDKLTFLSLDDTEGITDAGIEHIAKHRNLEHVFLSYTQLTDVGMKHIQSLKSLRRAWFEGTNITDASMAGFRLMPNIQEIGIAFTAVTTDGLMELADIRNLKKVGAKGCDNITADGIRRFMTLQPNCIVETELNVGG